MASYPIFSLAKPPGLSPFDPGDRTSVHCVGQAPFTYGFLTPEVPRQFRHDFRGDGFFAQYNTGQEFDMAVESGGDTYDLCGHSSYRTSDEDIRLSVADGSFVLRKRRDYVPMMLPGEEEGDPEVFSGFYIVEEETLAFDDDLPDGVATQTRITNINRQTVWEYIGTSGSGVPNFTVVGSVQLAEEVTHGMLEEYGEAWQDQVTDADGALFDSIAETPAYGFAYAKSKTGFGRYALSSAGLAIVRTTEVQADEPEEEEDPLPYTLDGVVVWYESETRGNQPVVYEEDHDACTGNDIYGRGFSRYRYIGLIEEKIWKDFYGIYDQEQGSLDAVPWRESVLCAGVEVEGEGGVSRGIFTSLTGGTFRVTLIKYLEEEPHETLVQLVVESGEGTEYFFEPVESSDDSHIPGISLIETPDGEVGWTAVEGDALEKVSAKPGTGFLLLHARKARSGARWGHFPGVEQDPPPETTVEQHRYRLKTLRKEARP